MSVTGTIAAATPEWTFDSTATQTISGVADPVIKTTFQSVGKVSVKGTGAIAIAPLEVRAWGEQIGPPVTGTGSIATAPMTAWITASEIMAGTINVRTAPMTADLSGEENIGSRIAAFTPPMKFDAAAISIGGTIAAETAPATFSATGNIGEVVLITLPIVTSIELSLPIQAQGT